ncbi:MAG: hypothetical protein WBB89_09445 [Candidatus Acidiferrum sp.]
MKKEWHMHNSFRFNLLACTVVLTSLVFLEPGASQSARSNQLPMWKEARKPAAKGTRITTPAGIKKLLRADPDNCLDEATESERTQFDVYKVYLGRRFGVGIAVWGRGSCFCSPTGNCEFWLARKESGKYRILLAAHMVNEFGFLKALTDGARNLVTWEHGSAFLAVAHLYVFNGQQYETTCGWQEEYSGHELPGGGWVSNPKPKIDSNTCVSNVVTH